MRRLFRTVDERTAWLVLVIVLVALPWVVMLPLRFGLAGVLLLLAVGAGAAFLVRRRRAGSHEPGRSRVRPDRDD